MSYFEKHPMILIAVGIIGISLSSILVKYSQAPSAVTAAYRLLWTVLLMSPAVFLSKKRRICNQSTADHELRKTLSGFSFDIVKGHNIAVIAQWAVKDTTVLF